MRCPNPDVQFEAGGRALTLRFSIKALVALQDHWQLDSLDEVSHRLGQLQTGGLGAIDLAAILWAALRSHHSDLTVDDAIDILDDTGVQNFEYLITRAVAAAAPEGGGDAPANPPKRGRKKPGRSTG